MGSFQRSSWVCVALGNFVEFVEPGIEKKKNTHTKRTNYPHLFQFSFWFVAEKGTATLSKWSCLVLDNFVISNKGRWVWVARGVGIEYSIFINNTLLSLLSLYLIKSKMNCSTSRGHWECTFLTVAIATGSVYVDKIWFINKVWINQMQEFLLDNFLKEEDLGIVSRSTYISVYVWPSILPTPAPPTVGPFIRGTIRRVLHRTRLE